MRAFVQHRPLLPWKVWYVGPNFRYERPQKGRYRQHDQVGVEALGVDDPDLDVEVIALGWRFYASLGLRQVRLLLNSMGERDDRARYTEALRAYLESPRRRARPTRAARRSTRNPLRVLDSKRPEDRRRRRRRPGLADHLSPSVAGALRAGAAPASTRSASRTRSTPRLVRGLDYYRRTTFEFAARRARRGAERDRRRRSLRRAGRGAGWAADRRHRVRLGIERILLACDAEGVFPAPATDARRVRRRPRRRRRGAATSPTSCGPPASSADRRFGGRSMKAQMKSADRSGARVRRDRRRRRGRRRRGHAATAASLDPTAARGPTDCGEQRRVDRDRSTDPPTLIGQRQ